MVGLVEKRYDIHKMTINGESGDVSGDTIVSWKERIPDSGDIQLEIFVICMKQDVFGVHSQNTVLEGRSLSVTEGKRLNKDL